MRYPVFPVTKAPLRTRPSLKKLLRNGSRDRDVNFAIQGVYAEIEQRLLMNHLGIDPDFAEFQKLSKQVRFLMLYGGDPAKYFEEILNG